MPIYNFLSGTDEQKDLWRVGPSLMMHLAVESLPVSIDVDFVPPDELTGQTSLAETFWTYDDGHSVTKVRNDYPVFGSGDGKQEELEAQAAGMGIEYSPIKHSRETAVHELGHSLFASLPHATRLKIAALFGADTDEVAVINDTSKPWQDRIAEGIAENFKEAFLPARYRVFPNRTNLHIGYKNFPELRRLFRGVSGDATNDFCYLYGSNNFRVDLSKYGLTKLPYHRSDRDPEAFVEYQQGGEGFERGWGVQMSQFEESGKMPFSIELVEIES